MVSQNTSRTRIMERFVSIEKITYFGRIKLQTILTFET